MSRTGDRMSKVEAPSLALVLSISLRTGAAVVAAGDDDAALPCFAVSCLSLAPPTMLLLLVWAAGQRDGGMRAEVPMRRRTAAYGGGHLRAAQRSQGWQRHSAGYDPRGQAGRLLLKGGDREGRVSV